MNVSKYLLERLENYGSIKWHLSRHGSKYIKFRDVRLGSIRIADHNGRKKYNYTYEIFMDDENIKQSADVIINSVIQKSQILSNFNPYNYVVYSKSQSKYITVETFEEYKNAILKGI